ncbi:MAG: GNAT family N-acetyltransferase [Bacillota bacterium]
MIRLDLLKEEDLMKIIAWNNGRTADYLLQWSGPLFKFPLTLEQLEDYYLKEVTRGNSNISVYRIVLLETNEVIGTIELREFDKESKIGKVCRFLIGDENVRGRGVGTLALEDILRIGFEDLRFEKIILSVFDFNLGAIKCYENAGFKKEKLMENATKSSTGYWNSYQMGIYKGEWNSKEEGESHNKKVSGETVKKSL